MLSFLVNLSHVLIAHHLAFTYTASELSVCLSVRPSVDATVLLIERIPTADCELLLMRCRLLSFSVHPPSRHTQRAHHHQHPEGTFSSSSSSEIQQQQPQQPPTAENSSGCFLSFFLSFILSHQTTDRPRERERERERWRGREAGLVRSNQPSVYVCRDTRGTFEGRFNPMLHAKKEAHVKKAPLSN